MNSYPYITHPLHDLGEFRISERMLLCVCVCVCVCVCFVKVSDVKAILRVRTLLDFYHIFYIFTPIAINFTT